MLARALGHFNTPVEVLTARGGQEALEVIGQRAPDVLITDFMMPDMNGLDLIEKLQGGREPALTILVTAYDTPGLAAAARRLRVNQYLIKPVQPETIRSLVGEALERIAAPRPSFAEIPPASQFKILVADDYADNIRLLARHLEGEGYTLLTATDGEETLRCVRADQPDLLLLDVNMPTKNGFEVLAEMRSDRELAHIPVIMLTAARTAPRDIREGLGLGADDYITKPFDWRELAARIRAKLRVKHAEDVLRRRNRELSLLPAIGQDLSARLDVEEIAGVLLKRAVEALDASNAHLAVFQTDGSTYQKLHTPLDFSPWTWEEAQARLVAEGPIAHVASSGQGLLIADTEQDERWINAPRRWARSAAGVPLLGRRGVIGVLALYHTLPEHFSSEQLVILQAIASQAAIAIENAQLYAIERKRVNELVALNQIAREISACVRAEDLFEAVPQLISTALGYPVVTLWLTGDGKLTLRCLANRETPHRLSLLEIAPRQAASTGQAVMFSGAVEERAAPRADPGAPPVQSSVAVPLVWGSEISGVLAIHSAHPHAFQESDRVVLENLAAQMATALERIRLFKSAEQEERRLAAVLHGAADAILVLDAEGRLELLNVAGARLFTDVATRLEQPLPAGHGYDELIHLLDQARLSETTAQGEIAWPDKRTFAALVTPIEEGGQVAVLHDITHFKELDRVKSEFIATASHDLKNPITSVLGYAEMLALAGPLNETQTEFAGRIRRAAKQMHELVLDLLDLARVDLGVDLKKEPCNLFGLLRGVADEFLPQAEAKGQSLTLRPEAPAAPLGVVGDSSRLQQVARNLIGNAIKYTPPGGQITVSAEARGAMAHVTVQDTGIGIPSADLPFIFDRFYRVQTDETRDIEGNGLGLAIVKAIVEQHGGQMCVESVVSQGSRFTFALPLTAIPAAAAQPVPPG
jgi:signal transduction histidine kinase/DNA-binding response OmpR family regulator